MYSNWKMNAGIFSLSSGFIMKWFITFKLGELEVTVFVLVIATNCLYLHLMFFTQTPALFGKELLWDDDGALLRFCFLYLFVWVQGMREKLRLMCHTSSLRNWTQSEVSNAILKIRFGVVTAAFLPIALISTEFHQFHISISRIFFLSRIFFIFSRFRTSVEAFSNVLPSKWLLRKIRWNVNHLQRSPFHWEEGIMEKDCHLVSRASCSAAGMPKHGSTAQLLFMVLKERKHWGRWSLRSLPTQAIPWRRNCCKQWWKRSSAIHLVCRAQSSWVWAECGGRWSFVSWRWSRIAEKEGRAMLFGGRAPWLERWLLLWAFIFFQETLGELQPELLALEKTLQAGLSWLMHVIFSIE